MRIAFFAMMLLLSGCAQFVRFEKGNPEVIYTSDAVPPTKILRQTTVHIYRIPWTIEGSRVVDYRFDHHHSIVNPDQTTVDLPFLDSVDALSRSGEGVFSKIFSFNNGNAWVAFGEKIPVGLLWYDRTSGWHSYNNWLRHATFDVFVKTFTEKSLMSKTVLEVCNPSDTANPTIQFDESVPAIRFRSVEGTKIYLPMTGKIRTEDATTRCSETMRGLRRWKTYYERKSIGAP